MNGARVSLTARLVIGMLAVQVMALIAWLLVWMTVSPYVSYDELAAASANRRIAASVVDSGSGARVQPTRDLRRYQSKRAALEFAVYRAGVPLAGSSPDLVREIGKRRLSLRTGSNLSLHGRTAVVELLTTRLGRVLVVSTGNRFGWDDLPYFFITYLPHFLMMTGPAMLAAAAIMPFIIRRALRPLRTSAQAAAGIDLGTLHHRLSTDGIPAEVAPFVLTINQLLHRVEAGIARQRLFVANAAHELRTPIAVLAARIDSASDALWRPELRRDVERLSILVNQLLAASRLEALSDSARGSIDVVALARDVAADLAPLALRHGRSIAVESDAHSSIIRGSEDGVRSALANIVDNALRAEPRNGTVLVKVQRAVGEVRVDVVDHGPGVSTEHQALLFEPFWRNRRDGQGSGLGLCIALQISELHGGSLRYFDTPGGGATFRLSFPLSQAQPA